MNDQGFLLLGTPPVAAGQYNALGNLHAPLGAYWGANNFSPFHFKGRVGARLVQHANPGTTPSEYVARDAGGTSVSIPLNEGSDDLLCTYNDELYFAPSGYNGLRAYTISGTARSIPGGTGWLPGALSYGKGYGVGGTLYVQYYHWVSTSRRTRIVAVDLATGALTVLFEATGNGTLWNQNRNESVSEFAVSDDASTAYLAYRGATGAPTEVIRVPLAGGTGAVIPLSDFGAYNNITPPVLLSYEGTDYAYAINTVTGNLHRRALDGGASEVVRGGFPPAPNALLVPYLLSEAAPLGCFWTDLVNVTSSCGDGAPPSS